MAELDISRVCLTEAFARFYMMMWQPLQASKGFKDTGLQVYERAYEFIPSLTAGICYEYSIFVILFNGNVFDSTDTTVCKIPGIIESRRVCKTANTTM